MKRYIKRLLEKLKELYDIYQKYCWYHEKDSSNINIIFEDDNIIYSLYDKTETEIDRFTMSFAKKEEELYLYMSIKIFVMLLNNYTVQKDGNIYFNNFYRPHTKIIINDERIINIIDSMQTEKDKSIIIDSNPTVKKLYKKIPLWNHNKAMITKMGERIKLTKKLTDGIE